MKMKILKKAAALVLSVTMLLTVPSFSWADQAETNGNATISITKTEMGVGDTVSVVVSTKEMTVSTFACGIMFDKAKLECKSIVGSDDNYPDYIGLNKKKAGPGGTWTNALSTSTVAEANNTGRVGSIVAGTSDVEYAAGKYFTATFEAKETGTVDIILYENTDGQNKYYSDNSDSVKLNIVKMISGDQALTGITAPVKNAAPDTTLDSVPANTTAAVKWFDGDSEFTGSAFAPGKAYTVKITLTPAAGYTFASDTKFTLDGESVEPVLNSDGTVTITKTYPATAERELQSIAITKAPTKTSYIAGQKFDPAGMEVTATYDYGDPEVITGYTLTPSADTALTTADTSVTVTFEGKTAVQPITVIDKAVTAIAIKSYPTKTAYVIGEEFDATGLVVTVTYNDETKEELSAEKVSVTGFDSSAYAASQTLTVSYGGQTATFTVSIDRKTITAAEAFNLTVPSDLVYNGYAKTATVAAKAPYDGTAAVKYMKDGKEVSEIKDAGTYDVYVSAAQTDTYKAIAETKLGSFTILKKQIAAPTAKTGLVYNGTEQTGVAAAEGYTVADGSKTAAGQYTATAVLDDKTNTEWSDTKDSADKTLSWSIAKKQIAAPAAAPTDLAYNGKEQTGVAAAEGYTVTDGAKTLAGSYTATATLTDKENTEWADTKDTADKKISWSIAAVAQTAVVNGIGDATYGDTGVTAAAEVKANGNVITDGGQITWSSSDTSVATVDASTGAVTILKAGTTTITATVAAVDGKYASCTAEATLTVAKKALTFKEVKVADKTYDGTTTADVTVEIEGAVGNDTVTVTADGVYDSAAAGERTVKISNVKLNDASGNYTFDASSVPESVTKTIGKLAAADVKAEVTGSDLTQTEGSVKKPEVKVTPEVGDVEVKYFIKKDAADDQTEPSWEEWTDENAPSAAGTYEIRAEITSPNVDGTVTADMTLTVNKKQNNNTGGGGGGGGASSVTTAQSDGGVIRTSTSKAAAGATVTVTATANNGYAVSGVTVKNATSGAEIAVTKNADGTYSFKMPSAPVTVSASFTNGEVKPEVDEVCSPYGDVDTSSWYHPAVHYVLHEGVMTGTSAKTFTPNGKLSRAMLAQILYNQAGKPAAAAANFSDVKSSDWFAPAVAWAAANGVVTGYEDGTFRPNDYVTREQLAAMLYRYAGSPDVSSLTLSGFNDTSKVAEYAQDAMKWATSNGIITGDGNASTLNPKGTASRAQAATMIMRYIQKNK